MRRPRALLLLLALGCASAPLDVPRNEYGLEVVERPSTYRALVAADSSRVLVPVTDLAPAIVLDIRYATPDNFMRRRLYPAPAAWLRCEAALALAAVQRDLSGRGLGLKVFDAYRPYSVTEAMWESWKDPDYVADPARGSRHNRGAAVDATLVELATGRELPMPTGYDEFTPEAWHDAAGVSEEAAQNRAILREAMERRGFIALASEWWHYDYGGWERYHLLNLDHTALAPPPAPCG